jgi:L-threonylcarbamoyladenylate synthase
MSVPVLSSSASALAQAVEALRDGRLVAFPTETVYGLGADATNPQAVASIFTAKGRPSFNPLIAHVADLDMAERYARFDDRARDLAARHWPGPLTFVLPRREACLIADLATAGLSTIALRVPGHPVAASLLREFGGPIVAPSANRSGAVSPTRPAHVVESLGDRDELALILAAGRTEVGLESTVLDLSEATPLLLRPGAVTREQIEAVLGPIEVAAGTHENAPRSPGLLLKHYAPSATRVRLGALRAEPGEAWLGFGPDPFAGRQAITALNLSERGDLAEAAANLFAMLRTLDDAKHRAIAVAPIPDEGLGVAINDRLARAAHG